MSFIDEYIEKRSAASNEFAVEVAQESERLVALVELRHQLGMSQKQLAVVSGKSQSTIARIESGALNPSVGLLAEIAASVDRKLEVSFACGPEHANKARAARRKKIFERLDDLLGSTPSQTTPALPMNSIS